MIGGLTSGIVQYIKLGAIHTMGPTTWTIVTDARAMQDEATFRIDSMLLCFSNGV